MGCEYTFDNATILFYFTSDKRVDFRALLHEKLAGAPLEGEEAPSRWRAAPPESLLNILTAIMDARRQKNANVGWAALSEGLLQTISEEASKWQV